MDFLTFAVLREMMTRLGRWEIVSDSGLTGV